MIQSTELPFQNDVALPTGSPRRQSEFAAPAVKTATLKTATLKTATLKTATLKTLSLGMTHG